jgi:hypothetical protein
MVEMCLRGEHHRDLVAHATAGGLAGVSFRSVRRGVVWKYLVLPLVLEQSSVFDFVGVELRYLVDGDYTVSAGNRQKLVHAF